MARKDKPYLPLYIQDFMTDEKLMECSASATGVYIRIMCVMHKSIKYGTFLLKQKDKQKDNQILNFATKLGKHLPYDLAIIISGLEELIGEGCLAIEGDFLIQKRMMEDGQLSETRSKSGSSGGKKTQSKRIKNKTFAKAKNKANPDIDIDIDIENENDIVIENINTGGVGENSKTQKKNNMSTAKDTKDIPLPFKEPAFAVIWAEWLQYRRESRFKAFTPTGLKRTFNKLLVDSGGDCRIAIEMIDNAMAKSWQGIHPLNQKINGNTTGRITEKPKPTGTVAPGGFGQF
jgi:hypothetical protein